MTNLNQFYRTLSDELLSEKNLVLAKLDLANAKLDNANSYVDALTERSKDLLYKMALKDHQLKTLIKHMEKAYPEVPLQAMVEEIGQEYEADKQWLDQLRAFTDSQPVLEEKKKARSRSNEQQIS